MGAHLKCFKNLVSKQADLFIVLEIELKVSIKQTILLL